MSDRSNKKNNPSEDHNDDFRDLEDISVVVELEGGRKRSSASAIERKSVHEEKTEKEEKHNEIIDLNISLEIEEDKKQKDEIVEIPVKHEVKEPLESKELPSIIINEEILSPQQDKEKEDAGGVPVVMGFVKVIGEEKAEEKIESPEIPSTATAEEITHTPLHEDLLNETDTKEILKADAEIRSVIKDVLDETKENHHEKIVTTEALITPESKQEEEISLIEEKVEEVPEPIELKEQPPKAPPPPPPSVSSSPRPSKQPPKPPRVSKAETAGSIPAPIKPPPPPRGLSMKSIVNHLPAIISIPDDEIPRGEIEEKSAQNQASTIPEVVPPKAKKKWYEEIFNEEYLRLTPSLSEFHKKREINFIQKTLNLPSGSSILDLACGTGIQCIGMAEKGYQMVGLDLSLAMLAIASQEAQNRNCKINFIQKDMREMDFKEAFDGIYCIGSSFGYFDDEDNEKVLWNIFNALKNGGMFLLEVDNRDFVMRQTPGLLWFEGDGVVCMEETSFDFLTSRLKVKRTLLFEDGSKKMQSYSIRLYSVHELGRLLHNIGFRVDSVGGHRASPKTFVGEDSPKIVILAQKRFSHDA